MLKVSFGHQYYSFRVYSRAALAWTKKKHSIRNEKLKVNRSSETEEQRKERLRIRCEKDRARRRLSLGWSFARPTMFQHSILIRRGSSIKDIYIKVEIKFQFATYHMSK